MLQRIVDEGMGQEPDDTQFTTISLTVLICSLLKLSFCICYICHRAYNSPRKAKQKPGK